MPVQVPDSMMDPLEPCEDYYRQVIKLYHEKPPNYEELLHNERIKTQSKLKLALCKSSQNK